ncbi:hypothetical protein GQ457_17G002770 [Hibiscus cannabinus]
MASSSTSSMSTTIPSPHIFTGDNYDYWCIKMKLFLKASALWEIVEIGYKEKNEDQRYTDAELKKFNDDEMKDARALLLQEEFHGDEKIRNTRLNTLRSQYDNMKMKENEDIKGYTSRFMEVVNQMKIYGEDISDAKVVQKILGSLDKKFNMMSTIIVESKDVTKLSVTELMGSLLAHEHKFSNNIKNPQTNHLEKNCYHKGKSTCNYCKKFGHLEKDCWHKQKAQQSQARIFNRRHIKNPQTNHLEKNCYHKGKSTCNYCKKFGHLEKDCWHKQKAQQSQARIFNEAEDSLFYARQAFTSNGSKDKWLIDSGCTSYMTNDSSIFSKLDSSTKFPVRMGNGAVVKSTGKGTIVVQIKKGTRYINDVLLVPDLNENLLSVAQMVRNDYSLVFENNHCTIMDPEKNEIANVPMENKSFALKWDSAAEGAHATHSSDT